MAVKEKILINIFLGALLVLFTSSCGYKLSSTSDVEASSEEEDEDVETEYPYMEYSSVVDISSKFYGQYKIYEDISIDITKGKIKISNKLKNFETVKGTSRGNTADVSSRVKAGVKDQGNSTYTTVTDSENALDGSEYSKIKMLFMFVSKAVMDDNRKVTFSKAVPFLPRDDVSISSFLALEKKGAELSYEYKESSCTAKIKVKISVSEQDDDIIAITLDNKVTSLSSGMDEARIADFWSTAVFPKTSTYYMNKNKRIKTLSSMTQLIMSQSSRGDSGYYDGSNISTQRMETRLCKYQSGNKQVQTFDCE